MLLLLLFPFLASGEWLLLLVEQKKRLQAYAAPGQAHYISCSECICLTVIQLIHLGADDVGVGCAGARRGEHTAGAPAVQVRCEGRPLQRALLAGACAARLTLPSSQLQGTALHTAARHVQGGVVKS
jgi:hypothetical protein